MNEVYEYAHQCKIEARKSFAKLKVPFWKTNMGQKSFQYIDSSLWINLPGCMEKPPLWILLNIIWKNNILVIYLEAWVGRIIIGIHLHCIPFFIYLSIYVFIYLLIYFSLLLFWPFIVTFILLFYHLLYLLSRVSYYLLYNHFIISLCS